MNARIVEQLRGAIAFAASNGLPLLRDGAWFAWGSDDKPYATDVIGALLLREGHVTSPPPDHARPGYVALACKLLNVDAFWLYRFWMGFDRGYQILFFDKNDKEVRDEVSTFGIQLSKEIA